MEASTQSAFDKWSGYNKAQLRKLVMKLENVGKEHVRASPNGVYEVGVLHARFYIGLAPKVNTTMSKSTKLNSGFGAWCFFLVFFLHAYCSGAPC